MFPNKFYLKNILITSFQANKAALKMYIIYNQILKIKILEIDHLCCQVATLSRIPFLNIPLRK